MKRLLLGAAGVLVVVGGYIHYTVNGNVREAVDEMAMAVSPFGNLTYDGVSVSPMGTVGVDRLRFEPHDGSDDFRVARLEVNAGNLWQIYRLSEGLESDDFPSEMRILLRGIRLDMGMLEDLMGDMPQDTGMASFEAAGCGDRTHFSFADMTAMGYGTTLSDMQLEYRYDEVGQQFEFLIEASTEEMSAVRWGMELHANPEAPQQFADPGMAALAMVDQVRDAWLEIEDLGYADRIVEYCADETNMAPDEFREHHIEAWQANWGNLGMEPGEGIMRAYREFVHNPGTLRVSLGGGSMDELALLMAEPSPDAWIEHLNPRVIANNGAARPLDFTMSGSFDLGGGDWGDLGPGGADEGVADRMERRVTEQNAGSGDAADAHEEAIPDEPSVADTAQRDDAATSDEQAPGTRIAVGDLGDYIGQDVSLVLGDGREFEGSILDIQADRVQLRRELFDGSMEMPVRLAEIAEVRLR